jgi:hypothetical protein
MLASLFIFLFPYSGSAASPCDMYGACDAFILIVRSEVGYVGPDTKVLFSPEPDGYPYGGGYPPTSPGECNFYYPPHTCEWLYKVGTVVTLLAVPGDQFEFLRWDPQYANSECSGTNPTCTFTMPSPFFRPVLVVPVFGLPGCTGLSLELSPTEVWPANTVGSTQSLIMAKVSKPAPAGGCLVKFEVNPVLSKGHDHGTHPKNKAGTVSPDSCTILANNTFCPVVYTAPEISGEEKITAKLMQGSQEKGTKDATIRIRVPDLEALTDSAIGSWRLVGGTGSHGQNHYGTVSTNAQIRGMATDYFEQTGIAIGVNDMSLEWGGLFDKDATWAPPHGLHRVGKSVDVDHLGVDEKLLNKFAGKYGCQRYEVSLIHYECP